MLMIQNADASAFSKLYYIVCITKSQLDHYMLDINNQYITSFQIARNGEIVYEFSSSQQIPHPKNAESYAYVYQSSNLDWEYHVSASPVLDTNSNKILLTLLIALAASVLGSFAIYFLTKITYVPIARMLSNITGDPSNLSDIRSEFDLIEDSFKRISSENEELNETINSYYDAARNNYLHNLLSGVFDRNDNLQNCSAFNIDFNDSLFYMVSVISIKSDALPLKLKCFLFTEYYLKNLNLKFEAAESIENEIIVIFPFEKESHAQKAKQVMANLLEAFLVSVNEEVNACIYNGTVEKGFIGISSSFQNIKENQLSVYTRDFDAKVRTYYPTDWEIQLIQNIKLRKKEHALKILAQIKLENAKRSLSEEQKQKLIYLILDTLLRVCDEANCETDELLTDLSAFQVPNNFEEQWRLLEKYIENVTDILSDNKENKGPNLSDKIKSYIENNYADSNLSLKSIEQEYNIPVSTVFRLLKKSSGLSFYEYLCDKRISAAKDLIHKGAKNAKEIAATVGYDNVKTFYRVFSKQVGCTFKEYVQNCESQKFDKQ